MAKELYVYAKMDYEDGQVHIPDLDDGSPFYVDLSTNEVGVQRMTLSTTEAALVKGSVTTPGWIIVKNLSTVAAEIAYIRLASAGTNAIAIGPQKKVVFQFGPTVTAPYVIAASGTPEIIYKLTGV